MRRKNLSSFHLFSIQNCYRKYAYFGLFLQKLKHSDEILHLSVWVTILCFYILILINPIQPLILVSCHHILNLLCCSNHRFLIWMHYIYIHMWNGVNWSHCTSTSYTLCFDAPTTHISKLHFN